MEIVIKIEEELYNTIMCSPNSPTLGWYEIAHGTVLPKGHGRLIDADKLDTRERGNNSQRAMWWKIDCIVKDAPTIIEADKESDNEES